jgi:myo-inositol 2-dehydrogenase/D-chiro-inositol 1-dehydrogenase
MIQVCHEQKVQLMTAFPYPYLPAFREAKVAVDRGDIGTILAIKGTNRWTMPGGWFINPIHSGGGVVLDLTVHLVHLVRWFINEEPKTVYAEMGHLFHEGLAVEDAGMIHMTFHGGRTVVLDTSWSRVQAFPAWGDVAMEIIGTNGVISIAAFTQKNELYRDQSMHAEWSCCENNMNEGMIDEFIHALRSGRPVPMTGEDGMAAVTVALAAYESVKQGAPVSI